MESCLYALVIRSANEVAAQIAEHVGGTEQNFIDMMNQRAAEIGCTNTHFVNASGLPDENHYSTAHDMAIIASYAMKKPEFREIVSKKAYNMKYMDGHTEYVTTTNRFLKSGFEGANGIKTGFTNAAGDCLVASATRGQKTLIAVFYNDDYRWDDAPTWLEFGFSFYDPSELQDKTVVSKQNVIKLNKITEQRIKHSRETNKNLAALDAAIVNKAKSLNNKTIDVVDTAQQTKAKDVDVAENTKVEVSSDVDNNINNDEYKENNSSEENVEVVSDVTADMNTTEITTPEELNPSLEKYVY